MMLSSISGWVKLIRVEGGGAELHDGERRYAADLSVCNLAWFDRRLRPGESPLFDEQLTQQFFIRRNNDTHLPQFADQGSVFPLGLFFQSA